MTSKARLLFSHQSTGWARGGPVRPLRGPSGSRCGHNVELCCRKPWLIHDQLISSHKRWLLTAVRCFEQPDHSTTVIYFYNRVWTGFKHFGVSILKYLFPCQGYIHIFAQHTLYLRLWLMTAPPPSKSTFRKWSRTWSWLSKILWWGVVRLFTHYCLIFSPYSSIFFFLVVVGGPVRNIPVFHTTTCKNSWYEKEKPQSFSCLRHGEKSDGCLLPPTTSI